MASFEEHIQQAKKNLDFLNKVNKTISESWDWQVTVSFYVSVHLINAHIAKKSDQHYRSHEQVNKSVNPYFPLSPTKLTEDNFKSYIKLQGLARRSRYLCNDNKEIKDTSAYFTYDKHLAKALANLDKLLMFIHSEYSIKFNKINISCIELKNRPLTYFEMA